MCAPAFLVLGVVLHGIVCSAQFNIDIVSLDPLDSNKTFVLNGGVQPHTTAAGAPNTVFAGDSLSFTMSPVGPSANQTHYDVLIATTNPSLATVSLTGIPTSGRVPNTALTGNMAFTCAAFGNATIIVTIPINGDISRAARFSFVKTCVCRPGMCITGTCNAEGTACECPPNVFNRLCDFRLTVSTNAICPGGTFQVDYEWLDTSQASEFETLMVFWPAWAIPNNVPNPYGGYYGAPLSAAAISAAWADLSGVYVLTFKAGFPGNSFSMVPPIIGLQPPVLTVSTNITINQPNPTGFPAPYAVTNMKVVGFQAQGAQNVYVAADSDPACSAGNCSAQPSGWCGHGACVADTCICAAGMFGPRCDKGCPSGTVATLTAYGGRFYSGTEPNQPYLNNIVCSWLLTPVHPNVTGITIVFTDVGLEPDSDFAFVYEGNTVDPNKLVEAVSSASTVIVPGPQALVQFKSTLWNPGPWYTSGQGVHGFTATYYANGCLPGHYIRQHTNGTASCEPCPAGTYSSAADRFQCTPCAPGTSNPIAIQSQCLPCPVGFDTNNTYGSRLCQPCSEGMFADTPGTPQCLPCPAGYYAPATQSQGCLVCDPTTYSPVPAATSCLPCPDNSRTIFQASTTITDCACQTDYYTLSNINGTVTCGSCPSGGVCTGGTAAPVPSSRFWASSKEPNTFFECALPEACIGGATEACKVGHTGRLCSECSSGYYKSNLQCKECGTGASGFVYITMIGLSGVLLVATLYYISDSRTGVGLFKSLGIGTTLSILITFVQILGTFRKHTNEWPTGMDGTLGLFDAFNLNADIVRVECLTTASYEQKLLFRILSPFLVCGALVVLLFFSQLHRAMTWILRPRLRPKFPLLAAIVDAQLDKDNEGRWDRLHRRVVADVNKLRATYGSLHHLEQLAEQHAVKEHDEESSSGDDSEETDQTPNVTQPPAKLPQTPSNQASPIQPSASSPKLGLNPPQHMRAASVPLDQDRHPPNFLSELPRAARTKLLPLRKPSLPPLPQKYRALSASMDQSTDATVLTGPASSSCYTSDSRQQPVTLPNTITSDGTESVAEPPACLRAQSAETQPERRHKRKRKRGHRRHHTESVVSALKPLSEAEQALQRNPTYTAHMLQRKRSAATDIEMLGIKTVLISKVFMFFTQPIPMTLERCAMTVIGFLDTFFIYLLVACLEVFDCYEQPNGEYSLRAQASIQCFSSEWNDLLGLALVGIVLFGIGLPVCYYIALREYDRLAALGWSHQQMYSQHPWIGYFKFVWLPYVRIHHHWELVGLARKAALSAAVVSVAKDSASKMTISLVVLIVMFYLFSIKQPYKARSHNKLDIRLMAGCMAVLIGGMIFTNPTVNSGFRDAATGTLAAVLVVMGMMVARELYFVVLLLGKAYRARTDQIHKETVKKRRKAAGETSQ